jgi:peptide deformylase
MAVRPILELGDPLLRQAAEPVLDVGGAEAQALVHDLLDTLRDFRARQGYGRLLAAPQIGVLLRVFVLLADEGEFELINPRYERWSRTEAQEYETCLSFPGLWGQVSRPTSVSVAGYSLRGEERHLEATGPLARRLQHALDHLDGLLWLDREPDLLSLCTTAEYERRYKPGGQGTGNGG